MSAVVSVMLFIVAVPIAMELIGTLFALRDGWCSRSTRSAAINRVAVRLGWLAIFLAVAPQSKWWVILAAAATVVGAHVVSFYGFRLMSRRFPAGVIDRDGD